MNKRVRKIVEHAYNNTPAMKQRMADVNLTPKDIQDVTGLSKLPTISKDDMVQLQAKDPPFGSMLAVPLSELKWIFFSPGPLYEGVADPEWAVEQQVYLLKEIGYDANDIMLNALSYHLVPFGHIFDGAMRKLGGTVLPTGVGNTDLQVKMMLDLGTTAYCGTPSFLMALIQKVEELGLDFEKASKMKKALVTAEPLPPSLRETLEGYGLSVANIYGTAELGMLGYEVEAGKGFKVPDSKLVQICDPLSGEPLPDGEIGEIVVTNFNYTYPLIRLGTGDLSKIDPATGHLMGWMGRSGDAVKVRGMFLHPNQLGQVMAQFAEVGRYQAIITRPQQRDVFTLQLELNNESADKDTLSQSLIEAVPQICRVKPDEVAFVATGSIAEDAKQVVDERSWE